MTDIRVLYISYDGMTDPLGQSQVLPYLAGLSAMGYRITLLSCEKAERAAVRPVIEQICTQHGIDWRPIAYTRKPPVLSTIKDVRKMRSVAESLHREKGFTIVHCRSYISALIGQGMKRRHGTKFIFDMRGFWADERVDGGLWRLSNPLYRAVYKYFKRKEGEFLGGADAVISLTHAAAKVIGTWPLPVQPAIDVIPCCVDTELFSAATITAGRQAALRSALQIQEGAPVLGYVGSLGTWYQLPEMLAFFKCRLAARPDSLMLFVTTEPADMIWQAAGLQGIPGESIRVVSAGRADVPAYISLMQWGIFFLKRAFSKTASSPVKQGEIMAMGIPVICNDGVGDSDYIVQHYDSGVLIGEYNDAAYERALKDLDSRQFDAAAIRAGSRDYFDLQKGIASYAAVYRRLSA